VVGGRFRQTKLDSGLKGGGSNKSSLQLPQNPRWEMGGTRGEGMG